MLDNNIEVTDDAVKSKLLLELRRLDGLNPAPFGERVLYDSSNDPISLFFGKGEGTKHTPGWYRPSKLRGTQAAEHNRQTLRSVLRSLCEPSFDNAEPYYLALMGDKPPKDWPKTPFGPRARTWDLIKLGDYYWVSNGARRSVFPLFWAWFKHGKADTGFWVDCVTEYPVNEALVSTCQKVQEWAGNLQVDINRISAWDANTELFKVSIGDTAWTLKLPELERLAGEVKPKGMREQLERAAFGQDRAVRQALQRVLGEEFDNRKVRGEQKMSWREVEYPEG